MTPSASVRLGNLFLCVTLFASGVWAETSATSKPSREATLTLERTISLPGVEGRIDHFALDGLGGRLFVAALGNNTVEVVDLKAGRVAHSLAGLSEPQGLVYVAETNRLYVANGGDGTLRSFDAGTFAPLTTVQFDADADNLHYDAAAKLLYVGHRRALGVVDPTTAVIVADIPLEAHPESFQLEHAGRRIFVNVPGARHVAVIDRTAGTVVAAWGLGFTVANFPMALDEANHRLLVGCRLPARLLVLDTGSGREVAKLDLHGDCDDLFVDAAHHRIYASCGDGFIDVFARIDPDRYALLESIRTEARARTCFFDGERLYLAVPHRGDRPAEIRCYRNAP